MDMMRNSKRKIKNIHFSSLFPDNHAGDKEYFLFWSKNEPSVDPNIAELFAMISDAKNNTVISEVPIKKVKTETIEQDHNSYFPANDGPEKNSEENELYGVEQITAKDNSVLQLPEVPESMDTVISDSKNQIDFTVNLKTDKDRNFSTDILNYFSVVSELKREDCQTSLDYLSQYKTTKNLQCFTILKREDNPKSERQKGGILFKIKDNGTEE